MPWLSIDDTFHAHKKVKRLRRKDRTSAIGLWTLAASWCSDQVNNGEVPGYMLDEFASTARIADLLVAVNLWETTDDGYLFHDWLDYQPSREEVMADRLAKHEKKVSAGRAGGIASGVTRRRNATHDGEAGSKQNEADVKQEATDGKQNEAPSPPRPTPPNSAGSVSEVTHQATPIGKKKPRGRYVGGQWVNTPQMCPVHHDQELHDDGDCNGCAADRKAASA